MVVFNLLMTSTSEHEYVTIVLLMPDLDPKLLFMSPVQTCTLLTTSCCIVLFASRLVWLANGVATDSGGSGSGSAPATHGRVSRRASSALAALSVLVILLYLIWRFIWQCRKHGTRSDSTGATVSPPTSSARPPSCPSQQATTAAYGAGEAAPRATTTSPLSVLVRVAAAARFGADKVDCAVCLAELGDGEDATRLVPGCGHGFHAECIEAWFRVNTTCPLCRAAVAAPAAAGQEGAGEDTQYDSSV